MAAGANRGLRPEQARAGDVGPGTHHIGMAASARATHSRATQREGPAMGLFSKEIKTMDDLFLHVVQDIYYAENQIVKALPDMIEKATNRDLTAALKSHLGE